MRNIRDGIKAGYEPGWWSISASREIAVSSIQWEQHSAGGSKWAAVGSTEQRRQQQQQHAGSSCSRGERAQAQQHPSTHATAVWQQLGVHSDTCAVSTQACARTKEKGVRALGTGDLGGSKIGETGGQDCCAPPKRRHEGGLGRVDRLFRAWSSGWMCAKFCIFQDPMVSHKCMSKMAVKTSKDTHKSAAELGTP